MTPYCDAAVRFTSTEIRRKLKTVPALPRDKLASHRGAPSSEQRHRPECSRPPPPTQPLIQILTPTHAGPLKTAGFLPRGGTVQFRRFPTHNNHTSLFFRHLQQTQHPSLFAGNYQLHKMPIDTYICPLAADKQVFMPQIRASHKNLSTTCVDLFPSVTIVSSPQKLWITLGIKFG
jgi:hypothetical protein